MQNSYDYCEGDLSNPGCVWKCDDSRVHRKDTRSHFHHHRHHARTPQHTQSHARTPQHTQSHAQAKHHHSELERTGTTQDTIRSKRSGKYNIKLGDTCWKIAQNLCGDGNDWASVLCGMTSKQCRNLPPGHQLDYDCASSCNINYDASSDTSSDAASGSSKCPYGWTHHINHNDQTWKECDPSSGNGYRPNTPLCTDGVSHSATMCSLVPGAYCSEEWCENPTPEQQSCPPGTRGCPS